MQSTRTILMLTVFTLLVGSSEAQEPGWWSRMKIDFHRLNSWPKPFNSADRDSVQAPFAIMTTNGWRSQTTLGQYHFELETQTVNDAGKHQLRWILTQAPEHRRIVFVQRGETMEETAKRITAVHQSITAIIPKGKIPEVLLTNHPPSGYSAETVHAIYSRHQATLPDPRLPKSPGGFSSDSGKQ